MEKYEKFKSGRFSLLISPFILTFLASMILVGISVPFSLWRDNPEKAQKMLLTAIFSYGMLIYGIVALIFGFIAIYKIKSSTFWENIIGVKLFKDRIPIQIAIIIAVILVGWGISMLQILLGGTSYAISELEIPFVSKVATLIIYPIGMALLEILYRGYGIYALKEYGYHAAVIIQALFYALFFGIQIFSLFMFIMGIILGEIYIFNRKDETFCIIPLVIGQYINNLIGMYFLYFGS